VVVLIKFVVVVGVIIGCARQIGEHVPASWPEFAFSVSRLFEYLSLAIGVAANGWLPLGIAAVVWWTWHSHRMAVKVSSDVTQIKIAIVSLGNYLEMGVETDAMRENKEKGLVCATLAAWKMNLGLAIITGQMEDDALTAQPVRQGSRISFQQDVAEVIRRG
jgi:hypothetical protein